MEKTVVIVGRPNVGKSTLFNRFVQSRKAIVSNQPGTTRDRHYGSVEWCGHQFTLIDTGGYITDHEDAFSKETIRQIKVAIEQAHIILFVVDCQQGVLPLDREIANLLRKSDKPVLVVTNKADNPKITIQAADFYLLGFEKLYTLSATHGTGTGDLLDAIVDYLPNTPSLEPLSNLPKIAIIGKPNVGKSTFLNALLGEERSIVTPIAHTTRTATHSHYNLYGKCLMLIDTAGIRKKSKIKENIEFYAMMRTLRSIQQADVCIVLIDGQEGFTHQDQQIIELVYKYKRGVVLLVNKWDLMSKDYNHLTYYKKSLLKQLGGRRDIPVLFTSGLTKKNIYQAIEKSLEVYERRRQNLATTVLNKVMLKSINDLPPPVKKGKMVTIKYLSQLPTKTPTFAFFCNLPQYLTNTYKDYLKNQLKKHFNFQGVPLTLIFKKK